MTPSETLSLTSQIACVRRQVTLVQGATRQLRASQIALEVRNLEAVLASLLWLQQHRDAIVAAAEEKRGAEMNAQARRIQGEL